MLQGKTQGLTFLFRKHPHGVCMMQWNPASYKRRVIFHAWCGMAQFLQKTKHGGSNRGPLEDSQKKDVDPMCLQFWPVPVVAWRMGSYSFPRFFEHRWLGHAANFRGYPELGTTKIIQKFTQNSGIHINSKSGKRLSVPLIWYPTNICIFPNQGIDSRRDPAITRLMVAAPVRTVV